MAYSPNFQGNQANAGSRRIESDYQNAAGVTLFRTTPVSQNTSGQLINVDVTVDTNVKNILGVMSVDTPNGAYGTVTDCGRLENIVTAFNIGDAIYIAKDGSLTNITPDIGISGFVAGNYVVYVGTIVVNQFDITKKDIKLGIALRGQL